MHLYVHVPFCSRRCTYCDFAIAVRRAVPVAEYLEGIRSECAIRGIRAQTYSTVYVGGGTPSRLGGSGIVELLDAVRETGTIEGTAEVTLEANPEDVTAAAVDAWLAAGVNRLSLGAQSFDDRVLAWMHRTHTSQEIEAAVDIARGRGMPSLSLDLIFALPDELERNWVADLRAAVAAAPDHLSVYGLTVEPATPLGRRAARGDIAETPEDNWASQFELAHTLLERAGYRHYEVSNYARGEVARARHNQAYWDGSAYVGIGPSAHGFDGRERRWNESAYARWLERVRSGGDPVAGAEVLTADQQLAEHVYLGLRSDRGLLLLPGDDAIVDRWVEAGWCEISERHDSRYVVMKAQGWMRLDALAAALTFSRSRC